MFLFLLFYYGFSGFSIDKFKEYAVIMKNKYTFAESHDNQNDYKATVGSGHPHIFKISTYLIHRTIIWL
jgi:hypothetical protein